MNPTTKYFTFGVHPFGIILLWCCLFSLKATAQMEWQPTTYTEATKINDFLSWGDTLYAATYNKGIQMTADEGQTWQTLNLGLTNLNVQALVKKDSLLFAGTFKEGIFVSDDRGANWQSVTDSVLNPQIWSLLVNDNRLFAGTRWGIYYSDNNGTEWHQADLPYPKAHHRIIFSLAANTEKIIGGTNSYVFESPDNGENWMQYNVPTKLDILSAINYQDQILLGTSGDGILFPTTGTGYSVIPPILNEGTNIHTLYTDGLNIASSIATAGVFLDAVPINEGLEQVHVSELISHKGELYAGTFDHGVWKYLLIPPPEIDPLETNISNHNQLLDWTDLSVYPNPAGGNQQLIQLNYHVPQDGIIRLELYQSTGQHIATLLNNFEQKGEYQTSFDMSYLKPGNYYFAYQMGENIIAQPVFLIRK